MADDVQILQKRCAWQGYFRIDEYRVRHRLFRGGFSAEITREIFERGHAAALLPYDPEKDAIVLIEQFRVGALAAGEPAWLVEVVAGIIDEGETAEQVVVREAKEEAGLEVQDLMPVARVLATPGGSSETVSIFCGRVDSTGAEGIHGLAHEDEDIRVFTVGFGEAMRMLEDGRVSNATCLIALQWLALNRERVRARWAAPRP